MTDGIAISIMTPKPDPLDPVTAAEQMKLTALEIRQGHFARDAGPHFAQHAGLAAAAIERTREFVLQGLPPRDLLALVESVVIDAGTVHDGAFSAFVAALRPPLPMLTELDPRAGTKPRLFPSAAPPEQPGPIIRKHFLP